MKRVVVNFTDGKEKVFTRVTDVRVGSDTMVIVNEFGAKFLVVLRNVNLIEEHQV